mgnify:CR=1 FL=1
MIIKTMDASFVRKCFLAGANAIDAKKEVINDLNVFPVPDGDTGTNMSMTINAAKRELETLKDDPTVEQVSKKAASALLRGARGNSGVILSLLFRGFSKGLEGKENALFVAEDMPENWPFRCLLAMEPMPPRTARQTGGLLSHLHFQYASQRNLLVDPETQKLHNPMWYATVCDGDGTLLEKCNIVRALHRLPLWAELPEK